MARPVEPAQRLDRVVRLLRRIHQEAVHTVLHEFGHRTAPRGDHRRAARHRLDHAEPEWLLERDEVQQRARASQHRAALIGSHGADVAHAFTVDVRFHRPLEVLPVLHDAGDRQRHADARGDLDRFGRALVRMDPSEEQEVVARSLDQWERVHPDAVMDRGLVVELRMTVGIADRDVVPTIVVALEDRHDLLRREPVDGRDDGRVDQAAVRERQEVDVVVDQVELRRPFEHRRDVEPLPDLGVQLRILRVARGDRADQPRRRHRIRRREQRDVHAPFHEPLRQERHELLPRAVVTRWNAPGDRSEHRHPQRGRRLTTTSARSRPEHVAGAAPVNAPRRRRPFRPGPRGRCPPG